MKYTFFLLIFCSSLFAQVEYPKDYFRSPLDIPMQLSGNFGELRPNHFHAGFDMKTQQKEGLNVYAVADGYISRIKISTFGNGKTLYITHANGYTSVYGHLQTMVGTIEEFIKKTQYKEQSFEVEMYLKPGQMEVKKGELIALSGNTGASEGPHLHFEFRDNITENIINPMFFGFDSLLKDTKKPVLSGVYVYPLDNATTVNESKRPLALNLKLEKDGNYTADPVIANGRIGFGIDVFDYDDVSFNKNGVYKVQSFTNGTPNFGYQFDTYSFDEMRYINAFIDYSRYKKTGQRVQKLFMNPPYNLSIIKTDAANGVLKQEPNLSTVCRIEIADYFGNMTTISVPIKFDTTAVIVAQESIKLDYLVKANKESIFEKDNMSVFFPAHTFYEDFNMNFDVIDNVLCLHEDTVPAHSNFTISITDNQFSESQRDKVYIASVKGSRTNYISTSRKENVFTAKSKTLGKFKLVLDTVPPTISIAKSIEGRWLSNHKSIQFTISDALSGIKSYNGYLNGKWVLFEYDNKTRKITHVFEEEFLLEGRNELKIIVVDNLANSTIFETHFFRSQKK